MTLSNVVMESKSKTQCTDYTEAGTPAPLLLYVLYLQPETDKAVQFFMLFLVLNIK